MVDNDEANKSITQTDKKAQGLGKSFLAGVGKVAKFGAGIATAAVAGAAALGGVALKAADTASEIERLSKTTGMTTDEFQRWDSVMQKNGYSMEQASGDLAALGEKAMEAATGTGEAAEIFDRLGVAVLDSSGQLRTQQDVFNDTITALQGVENQTERNALASILLSTTGEELAPVLAMTNEELQAMKNNVNVIDEKQIADATLFKQSWDGIKQSFSNIVTQIGIGVMPMFQVFFDWINTNMPIIQQVFGAIFEGIRLFVEGFANIVTNAFNSMNFSWNNFMQFLQLTWQTYGLPIFQALQPLIQSLSDNWTVIWANIQLQFETAWTIIKGIWDTVGKPVFDFIVQGIELVASFFAERMPQITGFFNTMVTDISVIWETNLKPAFQAIGDFISNVLAPAFKFVFNNVIAPAVDACFRTISQLWTGSLKPILQGISSFVEGVFTGNWRKAWNGVGNIVKGVFNGMKSAVKTPLNWIIGMVNNFIGGLNKLKIPDWIPIAGGKGINISKIPLLAKGTNYFQGGQAIVGEQGPELVTMPRGSKVHTADETKAMMSGGITLNIQNFINNRETDIERLAEEIEFYRKQKVRTVGVV